MKLTRAIIVTLILAMAVGLSGCTGISPAPATPVPAPEPAPAPAPELLPTPIPPSEPTPATFTISDLSIRPASVAAGEGVDISFRITNTGDLTGSYTITHKINGVITSIMEVTLGGHVSTTRAFTTVIEGEGAAGTYSVDVNSLSGTFYVKATLTPTPTPTPEPTSLNQFLAVNFGTCETSLGSTSFKFDIHENDSILFPYDYWIQVEYNSGFFYDLKYSIGVTTEMNRTVCKELKAHQEKLARAVIELMPDKKFKGGYYHSWYEYPTLKVGLITRHYYSWVNYTPITALAHYDDTTVSSFQWDSRLDDDLSR